MLMYNKAYEMRRQYENECAMSEMEEFISPNVLEHLPPLNEAPILETMARVGMRIFQQEHAIPTPVDEETGLVDHKRLMDEMRLLVDPEYKWKAPFFDEHHLHWYAHRYDTALQPNPELAMEFRDMAVNKIWVPRQFHNFIHAVTIPPAVPTTEQMRSAVKDFRRKSYIYRISTNAMTLTERLRRVQKYDNNGDVMYIDPETKAVTRNIASLDQWRDEFIHYIEVSHRRGLIDLSSLAMLDLEDEDAFADLLPQIKELMSEGLIRMKGRAALAVDVPYEKIA